MEYRKLKFMFGDEQGFIEPFTGFKVEYPAQYNAPDPSVLGVVLRGVWSRLDPAFSGLQRRLFIESFQRGLQGCIGISGTLGIALVGDETWNGFGSYSFPGITLKNVTIVTGDNNAALVYDLEFEWVTNQKIARSFTFDSLTVQAQNYLVDYDKDDRNTFVNPFRAAPVLIINGPGLQIIRVTAIQQSTAGQDSAAKRRAAEAVIKNFAWSKKGKSGGLVLDGQASITAYLRSVKQGSAALPDAVSFDLEFVTGYGV